MTKKVLSLLLLVVSSAQAFVLPQAATATTRTPLTQRYSATSSSETVSEGLTKTVTQPGNGRPVQLGDITTVKYSCSCPESDLYRGPFSKGNNEKFVAGEGRMIEGWDKAILTMAVGERSLFKITDPKLGYGDTGVPNLIPPNAQLEIDLEILDSQSATANIDFDSLAMLDSTPVSAVVALVLVLVLCFWIFLFCFYVMRRVYSFPTKSNRGLFKSSLVAKLQNIVDPPPSTQQSTLDFTWLPATLLK